MIVIRFYASILPLFALACSTADKPIPGAKPVNSVKGSVTVNGKPAAGAFVLFIPKSGSDSKDPRPRATVEADGSFQLSTYGENDGAPAGEYWVAITWSPDGRDDEDKLGGRYAQNAKTRLTATVKDGLNELPPFQLR